jgi:hypothetical protein
MIIDPLHFAYEDSTPLWHVQVYIFASKYLNEVLRCNESPTKVEASLSSRLENTFK